MKEPCIIMTWKSSDHLEQGIKILSFFSFFFWKGDEINSETNTDICVYPVLADTITALLGINPFFSNLFLYSLLGSPLASTINSTLASKKLPLGFLLSKMISFLWNQFQPHFYTLKKCMEVNEKIDFWEMFVYCHAVMKSYVLKYLFKVTFFSHGFSLANNTVVVVLRGSLNTSRNYLVTFTLQNDPNHSWGWGTSNNNEQLRLLAVVKDRRATWSIVHQ